VKALSIRRLGVLDYTAAWALQKELAQQRGSGVLAHDTLLLVQHPAVVTLGRATKEGNLLSDATVLAAHGIALHDVERGGDVTVHELGQLVAYPIIDLSQHTKDLHWYLRQLEEVVIRTLAAVGLVGARVAGFTGVWCESRKVASIGVHARDWITRHGVALNVENDLRTFNHVVPCGIAGVVMTTVQAECARAGVRYPGYSTIEDAFALECGAVFGLELQGA
jgi:lipoyl(octanoyl) transferase